MKWRGVAGWTLFFIATADTLASGANRGSDVLQNVAPDSQVGGLADRHPISWYALDRHIGNAVDTTLGIPTDFNADNSIAGAMHGIAAWGWFGFSLTVRIVIDLFSWAFSLDLINGPAGALRPVAHGIQGFYDRMGGDVWLAFAVVCLGVYGTYMAIGKRQYNEAFTKIALSMLAVIVAMFFMLQPERSIGWASQQTNALSTAFLTAVDGGSDPKTAKQGVTDHLFDTLIYEPWMVLNFEGLSHCVDNDKLDDDGFPAPVGPYNAAKDQCLDNHRYAEAYLKHPPGSKARTDVYKAIAKGESPWTKADAPAVDIQQADGWDQRLGFLGLIIFGDLGAIILLGYLALAIILAQVFALVLIAFTPVMLVLGVFPGAGHEWFKSWLSKLGLALVIKAFWSLVLAVLLFVNVALVASTQAMGWLFVFLLSAAYWWGALLMRKRALSSMVRRSELRRTEKRVSRYTHTAAQAVAAPVATVASMATRRDQKLSYSKQQASETASSGSSNGAAPSTERAPRDGSDAVPRGNATSRSSMPSPTPAASKETVVPVSAPVNGKPVRTEQFSEALDRGRENGTKPKVSHQSLMVKLQQQQRQTAPDQTPAPPPPSVPPPLKDDLETERKIPAKQ